MDLLTKDRFYVGGWDVCGQSVLRNDRTPLNTPYTPQLVKLHLKRHDAYEQQAEYADRPGKQLVSTVKSKIVLVMQPVHKIRCTRPWLVWYLTAVLCVPFVMLVSPMLIAFSICTSPIWIAGITVLVVRLLVPMRSRPPLADEYSRSHDRDASDHEEETSPHHPNSVYRRAHLTSNHDHRGYG
ncbi:hypothetical protein BBJ28_00001130 [Nothophytophthora sp. Chile5]|nr:hypothetical protein BBJ28_00001130 [Nothophytophthora sp. Chile5]